MAECFFLDVGQGASNVILLGDRRAIVIDCGRSARIPLALLRRYVDEIVALIVSHNDSDHQGGAGEIITAYPKAIQGIYFLQDRPVEQIALYALVKQARDDGNLASEPIRLERSNEPRVIFADLAKSLSLELIFPTFLDNLDAQEHSRPNRTSAVLVLFCGERKIVFPGDSGIEEWKRIHRRLGGRIGADVLAVPHHGGCPHHPGSGGAPGDRLGESTDDIHWLVTHAVSCDYAIVSVGTSNQFGHPAQSSIRSLCECGVHVLCTQITQQCHDDLEHIRSGVLRPAAFSQSRSHRDVTLSGKSRNVACAGTVIVQIGLDEVVVDLADEHREKVDRLCNQAEGHPLCR